MENAAKKKARFVSVTVLALLLLVISVPLTSAIPQQPHTFYGSVTIIGPEKTVPAPDGLIVYPRISGIPYPDASVPTSEGKYFLDAPADDPDTPEVEGKNGDLVEFLVNGVLANQIAMFSIGGATPLDLTVDDTVLPTITLPSYVPDPTTDSTPSYSGTSIDILTYVTDIEYRVDGGTWTDVDEFASALSVSFTFTAPELTDGTHTIEARAKDDVGNWSALAFDTLTVDTTPPSVTITSPVDGVVVTTATITVTAEATDERGVMSATISEVEVEITPGTTVLFSRSVTLEEGANTITATATDGVGLTGSHSIMVTYTPPPEKATLTVDTTPVKGEVFVGGVSWGTAPQTQSVDPGTYTVSFGAVSGYTTPSDQTVTLAAEETKTVTGTYVVIPPEKATLTVDTTPVKGEVFVGGSSWGTAPQSRSVDPGTYTVSFGAVSGYTTPSDQTVTLAAGKTRTVTGTYAVIPPEKATLTIDTTPVKGEVFINGVSWGTAPQTRSLDAGTYTVSFGAVSGYTTPSAQTVTLAAGETKAVTGTYVVAVPDFDISVDPTLGSAVQGGSVTTTVSITSIAGFSETVSLSASDLPSGVTASFSLPSGTPSFDSTLTISTASTTPVGTCTVTITGTDGGKTHSCTYTLTVTAVPVNQPPTADANGPYSVDEEKTVKLDGTGSSDPDGDALAYSWTITNDPTGESSLTNSSTATPTFHAPSVDSNTNVTVKLTVDDGHGHTDSDTATVTVKAVAPPAESPWPIVVAIIIIVIVVIAICYWKSEQISRRLRRV